MKLSIVIPCLNEKAALPRVREMLNDFLRKNRERKNFSDVEILIVDDGSTDGTEVELRTWNDCKVIRHSQPRGYGAALKAGFAVAQGDMIGFMDMDSSYVPTEFFALSEVLQRRNLDCIFGCRTQMSSGMPSVRKLGNRLYANAIRMLCRSSLTDVCTGQRLFRRKHLELVLSPPENDLSYSIALTVKMLNARIEIAEHPVAYLARDGESKLSVLQDGVAFLLTLLRTKYARSLT